MTSQGNPTPKQPPWLIPAIAGAVVLVLAVAALIVFLPGDDDKGQNTAAVEPPAATTPSAGPEPSTTSAAPSSPATSGAGANCVYTPNGQPAARPVPQPPANPTFPEIIRANVETNMGTMIFELQAGKAPCTVNALKSMAEAGYFVESPCHRLVTKGIFILQCGDPTGAGSGSPGYFYAEENLPTTAQIPYPKGSIAMANTGQPGSTGSQFFINYEESPLPANYTLVGSVIRGLDLVETVAQGGDDGSFGDVGGGKPKITMVIKKVSFY